MMKMTIEIENEIYSILDLNIEALEEESLAYSNVTEKIIVFNNTATKIWEYLLKNAEHKKAIGISDICDMLMQEYNIQSDQYNNIFMDIHDIISDFINQGLLIGAAPLGLDIIDCEEVI